MCRREDRGPRFRPQRSSHGRTATKTPGRIHTDRKERHEA